MENSKGTSDKDVKPSYVPPGYVKQQHDGLAETAGDQRRLETSEQKNAVKATKFNSE